MRQDAGIARLEAAFARPKVEFDPKPFRSAITRMRKHQETEAHVAGGMLGISVEAVKLSVRYSDGTENHQQVELDDPGRIRSCLMGGESPSRQMRRGREVGG